MPTPPSGEPGRTNALTALGLALREADYRFVTVTPETHRRVDARALRRNGHVARSLRDVFGWSRPFNPALLSARMMALAKAAGILVEEGARLRSTVRFSSLGEHLFVHSAYPTTAADAVFFGPDTYRFCDLLRDELAKGPRAHCVVDVGCGSGAGAIACAGHAGHVIFADINPAALALAEVNARLARLEAGRDLVVSDVLSGVDAPIDVVIANPPYMRDGPGRAYRDGGGRHGEELAIRITREALARLEPGGRLILYTGAAIVEGSDDLRAAVGEICRNAHAAWSYRELDPDVFGEEIEQNEQYAEVERIAAVALIARLPPPR